MSKSRKIIPIAVAGSGKAATASLF
ncbi:MAG: hypothetical protein JWP79_2845, partial [Polaromonas sp.]|nr:hypothetical protein [Polaromonas sp.]